jgi:hypothetical protein
MRSFVDPIKFSLANIENVYRTRIRNTIAKRYADKRYSTLHTNTGYLGDYRKVLSGVCIIRIGLACPRYATYSESFTPTCLKLPSN